MAFETIEYPHDDRPVESEAALDEAEIRYSLTALGEALLGEKAGPRFSGFGPCPVAGVARARAPLPAPNGANRH